MEIRECSEHGAPVTPYAARHDQVASMFLRCISGFFLSCRKSVEPSNRVMASCAPNLYVNIHDNFTSKYPHVQLELFWPEKRRSEGSLGTAEPGARIFR